MRSTGRAFASVIRMLSTVPVPPLPSPAVDRSAPARTNFAESTAHSPVATPVAYTTCGHGPPGTKTDRRRRHSCRRRRNIRLHRPIRPIDRRSSHAFDKCMAGAAACRVVALAARPFAGPQYAVRATCTAEAHAVAIATPIYPPFLAAPVNNDARRLVPLRAEVADGGALRHELDLGALEDALALPSTRLLMWCQPHNPSGRCWSAEEMAAVARSACSTASSSPTRWVEMPLEPEAVPFVSALSLLDDVEGLRDKLIVLTSPPRASTSRPPTSPPPSSRTRRSAAASPRAAATPPR